MALDVEEWMGLAAMRLSLAESLRGIRRVGLRDPESLVQLHTTARADG